MISRNSNCQGRKLCTLVTPPMLHDGHLDLDEVQDAYNVSSLRIHVERCIQRVKIFKILHKIPVHLFPL